MERRLTGSGEVDDLVVIYSASGQPYSDGAAGKFLLTIAGQRIEATVSAINGNGDFTISGKNGENIGTGSCRLLNDLPIILRDRDGDSCGSYYDWVCPCLKNSSGLQRSCNLRFSVGNQRISLTKIFEAEELLLIDGVLRADAYGGVLTWEALTTAGKSSVSECDLSEFPDWIGMQLSW